MKDVDQLLNYLVGQVKKKFKSESKFVDSALVKKIFEEMLDTEIEKLVKID